MTFVGASLTMHIAAVNSSAPFSGYNYSNNIPGSHLSFQLPPLPVSAAVVVFTTYSDSRMFAVSNTSAAVSPVLSQVVDVVIAGVNTSVLASPAYFSLVVHNSSNSTGLLRCVYFDVSGLWLTTGVTTIGVEGSVVSCSTKHLTNFAVLLVSASLTIGLSRFMKVVLSVCIACLARVTVFKALCSCSILFFSS